MKREETSYFVQLSCILKYRVTQMKAASKDEALFHAVDGCFDTHKEVVPLLTKL